MISGDINPIPDNYGFRPVISKINMFVLIWADHFEDVFATEHKDRYPFMCAMGVHEIEKPL